MTISTTRSSRFFFLPPGRTLHLDLCIIASVHAQYIADIQIDIVDVFADDYHVFACRVDDRNDSLAFFQVVRIRLFDVCEVKAQTGDAVAQAGHIFFSANMRDDVRRQFSVFTHFELLLQSSCI